MEDNKLNKQESTEEKIKNAARTVFLKKGFAGTKTRDIAEASGENLALINYYFRSKNNLFKIIMIETMGTFLNSMVPVLNNEQSTLEDKVKLIVENYIDLLSKQPGIPLFVMNELQSGSSDFIENIAIKDKLRQSIFFKQLAERAKSKKMTPIHPLHLLLNIIGMTVFPFVASPMVKAIGGINDESFMQLMEERKKMVPIWIDAILKA